MCPSYCFFKDLFIYLLCVQHSASMYACTPERAPDLITDDYETPRGCLELNSGPLEEQPVLLTTEPSLQPLKCVLKSSLIHALKKKLSTYLLQSEVLLDSVK